MCPLKEEWRMENTGKSRRVVRLSSRGRRQDGKIREGTPALRWLWVLMMTLQGGPRRSAAKGNGAATVKGRRVLFASADRQSPRTL